MVSIAKNVGHAMTYKIVTADTQKIIYHSNLSSATSVDPNKHVALLGGEPSYRSALPVISHIMLMLMGKPRITSCPSSAQLILLAALSS